MSYLISFPVSALLPWESTVLSTLVLLSFWVDLKFPFVFVVSRFHPCDLILYEETYSWSSFCFGTLVSRRNLCWNFYFVVLLSIDAHFGWSSWNASCFSSAQELVLKWILFGLLVLFLSHFYFSSCWWVLWHFTFYSCLFASGSLLDFGSA